jgi:hypothetical protein
VPSVQGRIVGVKCRMPLDYPNPELRSGLVCLRKWTYEDLACIEAASSDPRIPQGTTVPAHYTEEEGRAFIERQWGRQTKGQGLSLAIADAKTGVRRVASCSSASATFEGTAISGIGSCPVCGGGVWAATPFVL